MRPRGKPPIDPEIRKEILDYVSKNFKTFRAFAKDIGINESTLHDILKKGNNILRKNKETLMRFYHERIKGDVKVLESQGSLSPEQIAMLTTKFSMGADSVISATRRLISSEGSKEARDTLRELLEPQITDLYHCVKALSSEHTLQEILSDVRKGRIISRVFVEGRKND